MRSEDVRHHLRFDVARLRRAALRLQAVDDALRTLRHRLLARSRVLRDEAGGEPVHRFSTELGPLDPVPLRAAQAQATAELARRSALREVLHHAEALSLVAAMAVSRWVEAILTTTSRAGGRERRVAMSKGHIDAGRLAHRMLVSLRRGRGLKSGCGQLVCAVVVAELASPGIEEFLDEQIDDGWVRAVAARGVGDEAEALAAASAALRQGAELLEGMAERAEPAARELVARADHVEQTVEGEFTDSEDQGPTPGAGSGQDGGA